jgi:hypothetical protein
VYRLVNVTNLLNAKVLLEASIAEQLNLPNGRHGLKAAANFTNSDDILIFK